MIRMKKTVFYVVLMISSLLISCGGGQSVKFDVQRIKDSIEQVIADSIQIKEIQNKKEMDNIGKFLEELIPKVEQWVVKGYDDMSFKPEMASSYLEPKGFKLNKISHSWQMKIDYFDENTGDFDEKYTTVKSIDYIYVKGGKNLGRNRVYDENWVSEIIPTNKAFVAVAFAWYGNSFFYDETTAETHGAIIDVAYPACLSDMVHEIMKSLGYKKDGQEQNTWCGKTYISFEYAGDKEAISLWLSGNG